jgi:GAF domain-containing protein
MADLSALEFAEHARDLAGSEKLEDALELIVDLALDSTGSDFASVTLVHSDGAVETPAASDPVVEQADALQYTLHEGPCLTAAEDNGIYVIADTAHDERWPLWGPAVAALGLRSVLSIHLFTTAQALGALNLYAVNQRTFSAEDRDVARVVAAHASVALARFRIDQNLWSAVDARNLIGQAQGILMERFSLSPDQSFSVLRRYSQNHNRKLHDIAGMLVSTRELPVRPQDLDAARDWRPRRTGRAEG